jgi:deazaflavin-dependent oxidoreductase (nitroreductase family)
MMPEKTHTIERPRGLARLAFRIPIWLYRAHLGWLLGYRYVLLTHTGRKSGLPRQTVLEIVRYDPIIGSCIVASGWDTRSDWYRNVTKNPKISFQVGNKREDAVAQRLSPEDGAQEMLDYSHRHPLALRELVRVMGYQLDGSQEDILALGRTIPMWIFTPTRKRNELEKRNYSG